MNLVLLKLDIPYDAALVLTTDEAVALSNIVTQAQCIKGTYGDKPKYSTTVKDLSVRMEPLSQHEFQKIRNESVLNIGDNTNAE